MEESSINDDRKRCKDTILLFDQKLIVKDLSWYKHAWEKLKIGQTNQTKGFEEILAQIVERNTETHTRLLNEGRNTLRKMKMRILYQHLRDKVLEICEEIKALDYIYNKTKSRSWKITNKFIEGMEALQKLSVEELEASYLQNEPKC
jgi:hypothetical protein